jgi:hypothetical protein
VTPAVPNPNWPTLFAEALFGGNPYYGPAATPYYTDLAARLYRQWSVRRGKQFELDTVQAAEWRGAWTNKDGALDPSNLAGPFSPGVVPFRGYRMRAQHPPSVNLLSADQATGGEGTPLAAGTSGTAYGLSTNYSATASIRVAASGSAWQGTQVWQWSGTTTFAGSYLLTLAWFAVSGVTGTPYTVSYRIRSATTGANPIVVPGITWVDAFGNTLATPSASPVTLTGSPTAAWTTVTQTGTAPAKAAAIGVVITASTAPVGTWAFQIDGIQLEQASTASAFSVPGAPYPLFAGLIERYPQSWNYGGTYGLVSPVVVDTMALLSQTILKDAFTSEVAALSPAWFFPLNDPSGSAAFAEQAGRTPSAGLFVSSYGPGSVAPGAAVTAPNPFGRFLGAAGPVVTVNNPASNAGTVISLLPAGITGPPSGGFTRMIAFRSASTNGMIAASTNGIANFGYGPAMFISFSGSSVQVSLWTAAQQQVGVTNSVLPWNNNNWHLLFFTLSADGGTLSLYMDTTVATNTAPFDAHPVGCVNDSLGGDMYSNSGQVNFGQGNNYIGDIAHCAQWNTVLTAAQISTLYNTWITAGFGESSGARYARILRYAGYAGPQNIDTGVTTSMGAASDLPGIDALTALQNVVNTESGRHFVAADGTVTFQGRQHLSYDTAPTWTFGENQGSGELPYTDLQLDFDPTHVSNSVAITQTAVLPSTTATGQLFYANDVPSQTAYGSRTLSRSNQASSVEECRESAYWYLSRYKNPAMRVAALKLNVAANPALFPSALAFELGQRVRINRRDPAAARPTITMDGFIEQVTHTGDDQGKWGAELQVSPAPAVPYSVFTSFHAQLGALASSGSNTIVLRALPDAATNTLRSNLTGGQQLLISPGQANQELVTVAVGGVPVTSPGWTTATVTLTSNLLNTHLLNQFVSEPMPAGAANAFVYDASAQFDACQFSY